MTNNSWGGVNMSNLGKLGGIAVIVGALLAVVGAFMDMPGWYSMVLVILGLITGFFNVTDAESRRFLLAAIALVVSADAVHGLDFGGLGIGETITDIMNNLVMFLSPAVLLVALKSLFSTVKD